MARIALLLLGCLLLAAVPRSQGLSWRLFAGREECITEFIPDYQWDQVIADPNNHGDTQVLIDMGFVVTSRYGTEANRATVDFTIYGPDGNQVHREEGVSETEVAVASAGGKGPWKACFKVSRGQILRPSVVVKISYFTVNQMALLGTQFEWQRDGDSGAAAAAVDPAELGTVEQVRDLTQALQRLEHYMLNVTHEQRYLYARTVRHMRTVESTHSRSFWYSLALYSVIILSSFAQVIGVRLMFKSNKRGLII